MGRSGKGYKTVFFFVCLFFVLFVCFCFCFFAPVPQILKTCGFIVFKIHFKTVNRKSLMVHVFTSLYEFLFSFLSVTEFNHSLNLILKSNIAQIDRTQNPNLSK